MAKETIPKLRFAREFTSLDEQEARDRGYLSHVLADFGDGRLFPLFFYDPVRLQQDLEERSAHGEVFLADPGMVVVQEITLEVMRQAVERLRDEGFFEHLVPITEEELARNNPYQWPPGTRTEKGSVRGGEVRGGERDQERVALG